MKKLTLTNHLKNTTVLENDFIDHAMVDANGEFVKVYLFLLRHNNDPAGIPAISTIADKLNYTENDVLRALNYWSNQGLISYESTTDEKPAPAAAVSNIKEFRSRKEFGELVYVAETYLGKTLSSTDRDVLTYFYDELQMSADLIEYLIEYCVDHGHKSIHYINKVGLSWHGEGIATVEQAKRTGTAYSKKYYSVMNAFGLKGRAPGADEAAYIKRWYDEFGFSQEMILEACNRTLRNIHQPSFDYAEKILKIWLKAEAHTLKDVSVLDKKHLEQTAKDAAPTAKKPTNKFNNFDNRTYDMSELERKLVQQ